MNIKIIIIAFLIVLISVACTNNPNVVVVYTTVDQIFSEPILKDFENETGMVGQGNVGIGAIVNAKVPFISVKEQKIFIDKIDAMRIETKKLENVYQQKIRDLEELKKSILQKAFNGELTGAKV